MIIDTPHWVCHQHAEGISAIDVHPNGRRLVTCGTDPQIKVWNLLPILDPAAEQDPSVPKLLATLSEHQGSVLVVRFNHSGSLLASGGNDNAVLLYKLSTAPATSKLGAKFVNIENWRTAGSLRGHQLDITDLAWSPNDSQLATCSMDGSILIYNITPDGHHSLAHTIRGQHNGWVKGLAFDPVGRYLASQGRNGVKVWDVSRDWALTHHMKQPFDRAPEAAFRFRISWSPDGEQLLAVNASSSGKPTICLFKRQVWEVAHMVGHKSSVVAAAANPRMFYAPKALIAARQRLVDKMQREAEGGEEAAGDEDEEAAAATGQAGFDMDAPTMVLACGSNDRSYTVWASELALPLLHLTQIHSGPVVDLAWTPDGYTLIAASSDDSISTLRFSEAELGRALTECEFKALMASEYGEAAAAAASGEHGSAAAANAVAAVLDPEVAQLAAAANRPAAMGNGIGPAAVSAALPPPAPAPAAATAGSGAARRVAPQQVGSAAAPAAAGAGGAGLLERRIMPTGVGVVTGSLQQPAQAAAAPASRKRIHPSAAAAGGGAAAGASAGAALVPSSKRPATGNFAAGWLLGVPGAESKLEVRLGVVHISQQQGGSSSQAAGQVLPVLMTVENRSSSSSRAGVPIAEVTVHAGDVQDVLWKDQVQGQVVCIAGSSFFSAAATAEGLLHTWRPGGNMLLPPLALGCPSVRLSCEGDSSLLVVGADGEMVVLDFEQCVRQLGPTPPVSIAPLLAAAPAGTTLSDAWITGGSPPQHQQQHAQAHACSPAAAAAPRSHMAVLTDGSAWMHHMGLGLWMNLNPGVGDMLAQGARPGGMALTGDAERLRAAAAAAAGGGAVWVVPLPAGSDGVWRRKEAALQLLRSLLLCDANGYQCWLGLLANLLATQGEMARLKELAQDLLGPEAWSPAMGSNPWDPRVLGLDKRHLLEQLVIPAAAHAGLSIARDINKALKRAQDFTQQQQAQAATAHTGVLPVLHRLGGTQQAGVGAAAAAVAARACPNHQQKQQQQCQGPQGLQQQQEQVQQMNGGGLPGAHHNGRHSQQQPQQQHQQQEAAAVAGHDGATGAAAAAGSFAAAAVSGSGTGPRRIAAVPVDVQQQQNQHSGAAADGTAAGTITSDTVPAGRTPFKEHRAQQVVVQPQQHQAGQQLDKPASRPSSAEVAVDGS